MFTPYDWQEGIGNRAQFIEGKLAQGSPVLAASLADGILVFTYRRQSRKIYEIYDRLIFAATGQQSDVEAMRMAALEFTSREGFNRSDEDVTIQRVASAMSTPLKRAFSDFSAAPIVARSLFGEVGETPADDLFYVIDYDGDFAVSRNAAAAAGTLEAGAELERQIGEATLGTPEEAMETLRGLWLKSMNPNNEKPESEILQGLRPEAVLLERSDVRDNRFRLMIPEDF